MSSTKECRIHAIHLATLQFTGAKEWRISAENAELFRSEHESLHLLGWPEKIGENKRNGSERASEWKRKPGRPTQKMAIARESKLSSNGCARITNNSRKDGMTVMTDEREKKLAKLLYLAGKYSALLSLFGHYCYLAAAVRLRVHSVAGVGHLPRRSAGLRLACERASTINGILHSFHAKQNGK